MQENKSPYWGNVQALEKERIGTGNRTYRHWKKNVQALEKERIGTGKRTYRHWIKNVQALEKERIGTGKRTYRHWKQNVQSLEKERIGTGKRTYRHWKKNRLNVHMYILYTHIQTFLDFYQYNKHSVHDTPTGCNIMLSPVYYSCEISNIYLPLIINQFYDHIHKLVERAKQTISGHFYNTRVYGLQ